MISSIASLFIPASVTKTALKLSIQILLLCVRETIESASMSVCLYGVYGVLTPSLAGLNSRQVLDLTGLGSRVFTPLGLGLASCFSALWLGIFLTGRPLLYRGRMLM
jgi:hypothetical protein